MSNINNQSPTASKLLVQQATAVGLDATVIENSKGQYRRYGANGSTHVPQKVVLLNGVRMSIGQARQFIDARRGET
jgi:hypothetical protein